MFIMQIIAFHRPIVALQRPIAPLQRPIVALHHQYLRCKDICVFPINTCFAPSDTYFAPVLPHYATDHLFCIVVFKTKVSSLLGHQYISTKLVKILWNVKPSSSSHTSACQMTVIATCHAKHQPVYLYTWVHPRTAPGPREYTNTWTSPRRWHTRPDSRPSWPNIRWYLRRNTLSLLYVYFITSIREELLNAEL